MATAWQPTSLALSATNTFCLAAALPCDRASVLTFFISVALHGFPTTFKKQIHSNALLVGPAGALGALARPQLGLAPLLQIDLAHAVPHCLFRRGQGHFAAREAWRGGRQRVRRCCAGAGRGNAAAEQNVRPKPLKSATSASAPRGALRFFCTGQGR